MPAWEEPDLSLPTYGNIPLLVGLTSLPRRVWLDNPQEPEAKCISCGRKEFLIRQCVFAGIGSTKTNEDGQGRVWSDPHTISDSKGVLKPSIALGAADAASGQWTKIAAGILGGKIPRGERCFWVVNFSTVQNDKYLEAMEYEIPLAIAPDGWQPKANGTSYPRALPNSASTFTISKPDTASPRAGSGSPRISAIL